MRAPDLLGQTICDTYVVERVLGAGTMGTVLEVRHVRLPRRFAMKVLHSELAGAEEVFSRFRREAEIASSLGHPHIVNVVDWNRLPDQTPFLIMEYLQGEDLHSRMNRVGALPLAQVLELVRQVGSALAAAHKHGVVHRDLKPQNIFLCKEDRGDEEVEVAKVLDFGISKILGDPRGQTGAMRIMGTPLYMAPEQAMGFAANVDGRADQFALGAIIYHALSGRRPFDGENVVEIALKVMNDDPPPLRYLVEDLPEQVDQAVSQALSKDREQRFATIGDFVRALGIVRVQTALSVAPSGAVILAAQGQGLPAGVPQQLHVAPSGAVLPPSLAGVPVALPVRPVSQPQPRAALPVRPVSQPQPRAALPSGAGLVAAPAGALAPSGEAPAAGAVDRAPVLTSPPLLGVPGGEAIKLGLITLLAGALMFGVARGVARALLPPRPPLALALPPPPPPSPPEVRPPQVPRVRLRFAVTPPGAEIYLGGRRVAGEVEVPRSETGLRLEIRAHGYAPHTDLVVPLSDQRFVIQLARRRPLPGPTPPPARPVIPPPF